MAPQFSSPHKNFSRLLPLRESLLRLWLGLTVLGTFPGPNGSVGVGLMAPSLLLIWDVI